MTNLQNKTTQELQKIISDAQLQLEAIQHAKHQQVIAQIKELAASIGVTVEIHDDGKKTSKKVSSAIPVKFRNPNNYSEVWTGRGLPPKWLKALIASGHDKSDFLISN